MMPAQVSFARHPDLSEGLRERKKVKTRLAIEDAALALFEKQGYEATTVEEIAAAAEVSTTTFFRYFPTKADVVLSEHGQQLPALHRSILERPAEETDLVAVWNGVTDEWLSAVDAGRTARKANVVATSDVLSGLSFHRGHQWLDVIADALAKRHGRRSPDARSSLAARVALEALGEAVESWIAHGCVGELGEAIDRSFELMIEVCGDLADSAKRRPRRRR
jgi:AcrR family transcriptional regulator